jgi:broad specificity phosphatase PhoE
LAGVAKVAEIDVDAVEWDYGDYEGHTSTDIRKEKSGWNVFRDGCPGGESAAQVGSRADRHIARLRRLEGNIALFTHGHFGRVVGARWIGLPVRQAQHLLPATASLSVLGYEHDRADMPAIVFWNAAA